MDLKLSPLTLGLGALGVLLALSMIKKIGGGALIGDAGSALGGAVVDGALGVGRGVLGAVVDVDKQVTDSAKNMFFGLGDTVDDAFANGVYVVTDRLGVPRTNQQKCADARRDGRLYDAAFECPASDFVSEVWNRRPVFLGGY